jgi:CRISPR-associated protein Cas1
MITFNDFRYKQILFVFLNEGEKVSFSNDNIIVKDKEGKIKFQSTCYRLFSVFLIGSLSFTDQLIKKSHHFGFSIVLMTSSFRVHDILGFHMEGNVLLRKKQYQYIGNDLAKHILYNKLTNQRYALNLQRQKSLEVKTAIQKIDGYLNEILIYDGEIEGLLGIEGSAARIYFKNHFNNIDWQGRKPRIKNDYINSTLDIGYTLVFNLIDTMLRLFGFDTYQGVMHKQFYMRKSLVCDLIEPFRPLIDLQIKKAINLNQCKPDDFMKKNGRYDLKWEKNKEYTAFLMKPLIEEKEEIFLYIQSYYRCFIKEKEIKKFPTYRIGD